ncbi:MAG: SurA N-terminal domain-containing protein [Microvirga sp.]
MLAGCGGGGDETAAHVGGEEVSTAQLEALVDHFRTEAQREGKSFPKDGTLAFHAVRNQLLSLLVYRTELKQAAERLGVQVSESEIARRLPTGEQEGDTRGDTFAHDSVVAQIRTERLFAKVTRGEMSASERNTRWAAFLARLKAGTKVRYEPGYAPGS